MPITKYGQDDWRAGWRVAFGDNEGWSNAAVLTNSTGTELGTVLNPIITSSGGTAGSSSVISAENSSTALLTQNQVFTGTAVDITAYGSVTISSIANTGSATNGLSIQQSSDGTNWDITDTYTAPSAASIKINVPRQARFLRVVYTNGGLTAQTYFRLQTFLNMPMPIASSVKPADAMSLENDFSQSISAQTTYNGTTLDLQRSAINAANSTGTGITAVGLLAQLDDTTPTTITENQFGNVRMDTNRALLTTPFASSPQNWFYAAPVAGLTNSTTAVTIKAAAGAGLRNYLTGFDVSTDGALATATEFAIRDGAGGTVLWRMKLSVAGLQSGRTVQFASPLKGTGTNLLEIVTLTLSVTGAVYFNAQGYVAP